MAWTKLDDDTVKPDQPLSAFVVKRLATNINRYNVELARATTFAYPLTSSGAPKVKWASYAGRRGTVVTVDVGMRATTYVFTVLYQTTNAALGGTISVQDIDTGSAVSVPVPGSALPTTVEIPYSARNARGLRGFHISFESDVSESDVGIVEVVGGVANQVFCEPYGSPALYPFTLATGYYEMYHLMKLDAGSGNPAPAPDALLQYQVCAFRHNTNPARPPHGVLVVWPEVETNPPILTTNTTGAPKNNANLYELGRLELFSISVEMGGQGPFNLRFPDAYEQTTAINGVEDRLQAAMPLLQPNAATNITSGGFLGCVLPRNEEATFAFFVQTKTTTVQLDVSFRAVAYTATDAAPDITFGVRDYLGAMVGTDITHPNMAVPRITGQMSVAPVTSGAMFMNGVLAGDELWGMRDAMPIEQAMISLPVRFTWGPEELAWGQNGTTDAVYYGTITANSDLYIYGFNCKVL